jgi:hypothetical protein
MTTQTSRLPFDLSAAMNHLTAKDEKLAELITATLPFQMDADPLQSPYEALLESIAYQSISGKAAATIFGRVKALSATGRAPTPQEMLKLRKPVLRKAGLSGAKILAMKDLAQKTIDGIVPSLEQAEKLSDEELVERLVSVRGIGAWSVEMFLIFRLGRPDVLPIHDLGVKKGWSVTYGKKHMPKPKQLSPSANAGAPTAPSPVGTCGAPSSAPATPPPTKSAPPPSVNPAITPNQNGPSPNAPPAGSCRGRASARLFISPTLFSRPFPPFAAALTGGAHFYLTTSVNPSNIRLGIYSFWSTGALLPLFHL